MPEPSLAARLRAYIELFSQRPDVVVVDRLLDGGVRTPGRLQALLPPDALAFAREIKQLEFTWVFADKEPERGRYSRGYNGGRVNLKRIAPGSFRYEPWPDWGPEDEEYAAYAIFDEVVAEGHGWLVYRDGERPTDARLVFYSASRNETTPIGDLEGYLTAGAKAGFTWYWQWGDYWEARAFTQRLYDASPPRDTPPDAVRAGLRARGASEKMAAALVNWLGADAVILLPRAEAR